MRAVELNGYEGFQSLRLVEVEKPKPAAKEILIEVKAAGINYAEIELTQAKYQIAKPLPFIMGFEASGIVAEVGSQVKNHKVGDQVTSVVSSGAMPNMLLPMPIWRSRSRKASRLPRQLPSRFRDCQPTLF